MANALPHRVLVVDDDADTRANLRDILELDNYEVFEAGSAAELLRRDNWSDFLAVLLDRKLPDGSAAELLPTLRRLAPQAAILIVTGYADLDGAIDALRQGAADYILKPINPDALRASLARVAERHRLAQEKERTEAAFRTLVQAAPCMIVILRPNRQIAYFSPFAEELTGRRASEVVGKDYVPAFIPEHYQEAVAGELRRVFAGNQTREFENPVLCKSGLQRWMVWHRRLLGDYEGGPAVLAVGQDITTVKKAQEKLLQAERLAAIGEMVTGLAHESGNALARSQSCLEMLTWEVEDRPEALALIKGIQKAQDHLQHLYEEVRAYAAPVKLDRELWDVRQVWRQAWENLKLARQEKPALLQEETEGVDTHCAIDQFRLEQVFRNILQNALDACRGPVEIVIRCTETDLAGLAALTVSVRDNGPGLTPEQRQRLFEPFFTTKTKGTGLGMAIALRIVEAHGGQIAVGQVGPPGAEILITLPRAAV
jgi:two-component system, LuxR family, sensor kinase FixL